MNTDKPDTEKIWRRFREGLRSYVYSRTPAEADGEDVLQDIFMRIHEGIDGIRETDRIQGWVYTIARRAIADFYRNRERKVIPQADPIGEGEPSDGRPATQPNIADFEGEHGVHEEVLSWLIPMIDELPDMYRIPLKMADVEGMPQKEIADRLGLSLPGAKSRVQRAREKLGEVLKTCCEVEFGEDGRAVSYRKRQRENCDGC